MSWVLLPLICGTIGGGAMYWSVSQAGEGKNRIGAMF